MRLQNVITAIRQPHIIGEYAIWSLKNLWSSEGATKTVRGSVSIRGFSGFSEYLAVDAFLTQGEYRFFQQFSFGPGALIDIGANMGVYSLVLAKLFPDRLIYAIEASPNTLPALQKNIALNEAKNVRVFGLAISDRSGTVTFNAHPVNRGTAGMTPGGTEHALEVPCQSLDDFVSANVTGPIAAIKMDVEGYETLVLRGAQATFSRNPPGVIFFEVCPEVAEPAGFAADQPARMLLDAGYRLFRANSRGALKRAAVEEIAHIRYENWIAVHARQLDTLKAI
jgi:FkbM family methyltransferase